MITYNEVVRLLALAAAADQRTVGEEDVALWFGVAVTAEWTDAAARRAIVEHYSAGADRPRITPAAITDRIRDLRRRAAATFELPRIPAAITDREYPTWLRGQLAHHVEQLLDEWTLAGPQLPPALPAAPDGPLALNAAPDSVPAELARFGQRRPA